MTEKKPIVLTLLSLTVLALFLGCKTSASLSYPSRDFTYSPNPDAIVFSELWGYVMNGCEKEFSVQIPLTDIAYFIAPITTLSEVRQPAPKNTFFSGFSGKVHIVSACNSTAQAHLILSPALPLRAKIISDLVAAAETYDGLQIDWENIPAEDAALFHDFLRELKKHLGNKTLSVAVKARLRTIPNDIFDYKTIGGIADKVIIMAYDEHWSTSAPGPIASNGWVKDIAAYAGSQLPPDKIIMGMSFYGRTWTNDKIGNRAWYAAKMRNLINENDITNITRDADDIPHFSHTYKTTATCYYDDIISLKKRCRMLTDSGIRNLAFWRIGFEDVTFWQNLKLAANEAR